MIEEQATIIELSEQTALVEIKHQSSCNSCDAQSSCGTSSLSQLFGNRPSQFHLKLDQSDAMQPLKIGDVIVIGLEDQNYLNASILIYLLPLMFLFLFAIIADQLFGLNDIFIAFFALFGLSTGFQMAKKIAHANKQLLTPQFIKKLNWRNS